MKLLNSIQPLWLHYIRCGPSVPHARFAMLSTAWSRTDPFWSVWDNDDPSWIRIRATTDVEPALIAPDVLERARRQLSDDEFKREYLGIPAGSQVSPFTPELYNRATQTPVYPNMLDFFRPYIIAHDVGFKKDRSTAVIGGPSSLAPGLIGMKEFGELQQGLSGNMRADALSMIDGRYDRKTLIIVDLTYDPSYADILVERFGERVIGLQITSGGDTIDNWEVRQLQRRRILVYKVSRTRLLDVLLREMQNETVRLHGANSLRAFAQLARLEVEFRQNRTVYKCPVGHHDDLAMSCAMVVWATLHPHLQRWCRPLEPRVARSAGRAPSAAGWT